MAAPTSQAALRRLQVPVLVDAAGTAWALGVLDTTLAFEGRVVLAESPPPGLSLELERALSSTAAGLARPGGAAGVATVSFEVDLRRGEMRYQESAPRLPAGCAVLEATTGLDL